MAALICLDYLCKNNRFSIIVGCNLLYDNYTCFRQNTIMTFSMGIIRIILIGLNKLSYLASIMYMHLHKYLFKHTYYLYIKYRPHYNVHVYTCHNSKWIYQMQHRNYVWHPDGITMRYDLCVLIHTGEEHISLCTCRSIAILIEQMYLICQVYSGLNSYGIQSNVAWTFNINLVFKPNVLTMSQGYLCYFVLHLLQRFKSEYKLILFDYHFLLEYVLTQNLTTFTHTYNYLLYVVALIYFTKTILTVKHNTDTDIYRRTKELCDSVCTYE